MCTLSSSTTDDEMHWGHNVKMIANFSPRMGLQTQCINVDEEVDAFSMCCGVGGPTVMDAHKGGIMMTAEQKKQTGISLGVVIPLLLIATAAIGVYMRKKAKPVWWPKVFRRDMKEETGHAPHREVDLRGRDYI